MNDVSCFGSGDGEICLIVFVGSLVFEWSNGGVFVCFEDFLGGFYSVIVIDGDC